MNKHEFWHSDDDTAVLSEYLSEHSFESGIIGRDTFAIGIGDVDRLPDLPVESECAMCATKIREIPGIGWRHLDSFRDRGGCNLAWPRD
jgi:hypothetical protein